jgi:putative transposase
MLHNTPAHLKDELEWLKEVDAFALCNAQLHLETAFRNFFKDKSVGFPKFKSKKSGHCSYTTNMSHNNIKISDGFIKLPKVGRVRIKLHRQIPDGYEIKSVTIVKEPSGKYYASILTVHEEEEVTVPLDESTALGLDYSSPHFYVSSDEEIADMPYFYRNAEKKLAREQRKLSKMVKGSNNYKKQQHRVALAYEKVRHQRLDWQHKKSKGLADQHDFICVEDINMQNMARGLNLAKATYDNGFGQFRNLMSYKLAGQGKRLITIDKWFPSSKSCHCCGYVNSGLTLDDRAWTCPSCGTHHNRDVNAAINIREQGLLMLAS